MRQIDADALKAGFEEDGHLSPYIEEYIDACPTVETNKTDQFTISDLKRAMLQISCICAMSKRCTKCDFFNPSALECALKGIPAGWWVSVLDPQNIDVVLNEDDNE